MRLRPTGYALAAWVIVGFYTVLGLAVLAPEGLYSGDIGLKYVQARALADSNFSSLSIPYPGEGVDPARRFFPLRPPFLLTVAGAPQSIFSTTGAMLYAGPSVAGIRGLTIVSILSAGLILVSAMALVRRPDRAAVAIVLGLGSPLWFYAVSGWEHAPAVACSTAAFAVAMRYSGVASAAAAGLLIGAGATLREEVVLVLPGLIAALWHRERSIRSPAIACAGTLIPFATSAAVDVYWFGRPVAAHLRHAVHVLQSALHIPSGPATEIPTLEPFTLAQRYEAVVNYWLFGSTTNEQIAVFVLALAGAFLVQAVFRSALVTAVVVAAVCLAALADTVEVLMAPKWLAGLFHVAPYVTFAFLPAPAGAARDPWPRLVLLTTIVYLAVAFAGVDTFGGKSLGPRLLLPLLPLLATAAVIQVRVYLGAGPRIERGIGWMGVALGVMALAFHLQGTIPAYGGRNAEDAAAVLAAAEGPERIIIADDEFTAQLFFPLYYRKIILLADTPAAGFAIGAKLADERIIGGALMVSRMPQPRLRLDPLRLHSSRQIGRMILQQWRR